MYKLGEGTFLVVTTISHYKILEKIGQEAWENFSWLRILHWTAKLPLSSCRTTGKPAIKSNAGWPPPWWTSNHLKKNQRLLPPLAASTGCRRSRTQNGERPKLPGPKRDRGLCNCRVMHPKGSSLQFRDCYFATAASSCGLALIPNSRTLIDQKAVGAWILIMRFLIVYGAESPLGFVKLGGIGIPFKSFMDQGEGRTYLGSVYCFIYTVCVGKGISMSFLLRVL